MVGVTPSGTEVSPPPPNTTGTGPFALAGTVSDAMMFTVSSGYDELSTCPTSFFVMTGMPAIVSVVVDATVQVTFGVTLGRRP